MRPLLLFTGFLVASLTGAVGARVLFPPAPPVAAPAPDLSRLEARVARLEADLSRRAALPPPAPAMSQGGPASAADTPPPVIPAAEAIPDARIEEKVREVIAERTEEARAERAKREAALQAEKDDIFLRKLQEALNLADFQREELGVHLRARKAAYAEYQRRLTEGGPDLPAGARESIRQELRDFVASQDEDLRRLLGAETFNELMRITTPGKQGGR